MLRGLNHLTISNLPLGGSQHMTTSANLMLTLKKRGIIKSPHVLSPVGRPMRVKKFFYLFGNML